MTCSCEDPLDPPDWLGREEQDWSRLVRSQEDCRVDSVRVWCSLQPNVFHV